MFGSNNFPKPSTRTFFGPGGNVTTVFGSGSNMFTVMGPNGQTGTYFKNGNMVSGPDGIRTVMGTGSVKTVFGPNGETHTIFENGHDGTIL